MRALFLAQGPLEWASSRYRAWWVAAAADWADCVQIDALERVWLPDYDAVVFPKWCDAEARSLAGEAHRRGQVVVWDLCDPIWWLRPVEARRFLPLVDHIVVSSTGLAEAVDAELGRRATVIPDRMDPAFHPTVKAHRDTARPVLLWYGQAWNRVPSLSGALLTLHRLAAEGLAFRLRVLDDGDPAGVFVEGLDIEYHRWRLESFHDELLAADVALCPPYPGPWGRMKSENREVTAWWAGLPVADGDDPAHLARLLTDVEMRADIGRHNRRAAEAYYDVAQSAEAWARLLHHLAGAARRRAVWGGMAEGA
jgi:hypothetical protein